MNGDGLDPMHPDVDYPTCPACGQPMDDDWCGCIWRDFWTDLYAAVRETYGADHEETSP